MFTKKVGYLTLMLLCFASHIDLQAAAKSACEYSCKQAKNCKKARCCEKAIKKKCHISLAEPISVTFDGYGVPTIKGGTLEEVMRTFGRLAAENRLFQIFNNVVIATGRAAKYYGPTFVNSDIMRRQLYPTDIEVQNQFAQFPPRTKTMFTYYVLGLNDRVAQVNANPALMPSELRSPQFGFTNNLPFFYIRGYYSR